MNLKFYYLLFFVLVVSLPQTVWAKSSSVRISEKEVSEKTMDEFVDGLMSRMTVAEKIGQLNLPGYGDVSKDAKKSEIAGRIRQGEVGGIFNISGVDKIRELQEVAVEESRLGIPILIGADICNGYRTIFPIPLGLSCAWKPENVEEVARISAREVSTEGVCWTYSPMVDISFDARWGRVKEGSGEDSYLAGEMAKGWVRGYQGNDLADEQTIMACVKHFALYGAAEAGRDYNTVDMSRVTALNYYMRPYQAAVEAGVGSVMTSFNEFENIPATGHSWLLDDILRKRWGFSGFVVSDYTAIAEMVNHGVGNAEDVSVRALKAHVDMDMIADFYHNNLQKALDAGRISMADIDAACRRMLVAKYKLGLFHDPYRYLNEKRSKKELLSAENRAAARRIAAESFVLLKNEGNVLPLSGCRKIAVVGPLADSKANMSGSWAYDEKKGTYHGLVEELQQRLGAGVEVAYAKGSNLVDDATYEGHFTDRSRSTRDNRSNEELVAEALKATEGADVIVAAMGESVSMTGEGASRAVLEFPETQRCLLEALKKTGKPVVMLLFTGRPLAMQWEEQQVDAILNVWFGGTEAAAAIVDVLTGEVNPSGKLTMTFPLVTGQCPIHYNHKMTGRPMKPEQWYVRYLTNYIDVPNEPLYPFGYGLSYTTYEYGDVVLNRDELTADGTIEASVTVRNAGKVDGEEIVQLYLRDVVRSVTPPVKELKGFQRVALKAGESKTVRFTIDAEMLKFYNSNLDYVAEPGEFIVMIGGNSRDLKEKKFTLK